MDGNGPVIDAGLGADVAAFGLAAALRAGVLRAVVAAEVAAAFGLSAALRAGVLRAAGAAFFVAFLIWRAGIEQLSLGLLFRSIESTHVGRCNT